MIIRGPAGVFGESEVFRDFFVAGSRAARRDLRKGWREDRGIEASNAEEVEVSLITSRDPVDREWVFPSDPQDAGLERGAFTGYHYVFPCK